MGNWLRIVVVIILAAASVICFMLCWTWAGIVLAALTVVAIIAAAATFQRPYLKVKRADLALTIEDVSGRVARFEKTQELVPLRRPLVDIRDRNLFTRGKLDDFEVSPGEIGERMSLGKYYIVKVVFKPPLAPNVAVTRRLAYNIYDAFTEEEVSFMFVGDYPTAEVTFRVTFPPDRQPYKARAFTRLEGRAAKPAALERGADGGTLRWRITRMKPGVQYHVEWRW